MAEFKPGGDQQAITKIANEHYGGYRELFDAHGWPWTGQRAMSDSSKLIKNFYGSIANFVKYRDTDGLPENPFHDQPSAYIKAFHGFHPLSWGCVGWKSLTRLETMIEETTSPFIMAIWVTHKAANHDKHMKGKVVGFYELSHETGRRAEFMEDWQDARHEHGKWEHSFRARRAWEIIPEFRPTLKNFFPEVITGKRSQATGNWSEPLPLAQISKLQNYPRREVPVFKINRAIKPNIIHPKLSKSKGYVRGGTFRRNSYEVGEPKNTEKELYILKLKGDAVAFAGSAAAGKSIFKVGLSMSPQFRLNALNSALPKGNYSWVLHRTTVGEGHHSYPSFTIAEIGEMAMKKYLGVSPDKSENHLNGEFYMATEDMINEAWKAGRSAALAAMEDEKNG